MSQSLTKIYLHIVFSTKNRTPLILDSVKPELFAYMASILKVLASPALKIGGVSNHVHILCIQSKNIATSKLLEEVKKRSSKWIKTKGEEYANFRWQGGYSAFSISESHVNAVSQYIANQKEHHKKRTFKDEVRILLKKYRIDHDERYIWD